MQFTVRFVNTERLDFVSLGKFRAVPGESNDGATCHVAGTLAAENHRGHTARLLATTKRTIH